MGNEAWNKDAGFPCINFRLTHNELHNLIHAMNEHTTNKELLKRLQIADYSWNEFNASEEAYNKGA